MNKIEKQYDGQGRLGRHKIEFCITKRYLDEYIIGKDLEIFDIGGGRERYFIYLTEKGHKASLLDLSNRNIEVAREKSKETQKALKLFLQKYYMKY